MVLQVRITSPDGTNPIIMNASDRKVFSTINSSDEGGSFVVAKNDPKSDILNPATGGYTKFWEIWDTENNKRLNYGPITSIDEDGPNWTINGAGRSALLADFYDSPKTFYAGIGTFIDSLRYENVAAEPRASTLVHDGHVTAAQTTIFGPVTINEKYLGLSKNTKDNVIDDQIQIPPDGDVPNTYYTVDSFWSGMSTNDAIIVDLGAIFPIHHVNVYFPWWGGQEYHHNDRGYEYSIAWANDTEATLTALDKRNFGPFHTAYTVPDVHKTGNTSIILNQDVRYIRVNITDVHAWYGSYFDDVSATDGWAYQCDPNYVTGSFAGVRSTKAGVQKDKPLSERVLKKENDCNASVLEIQAHRKFMEVDVIKPLALQRIDNNNLQISYHHVPDASEIHTTPGGYRKFEPGGFFRKATLNYSGAGSTYTKFFTSDCTNCYPDGFSFGVMDQNNTLIYSSDNSSGSPSIKAPAFTKHIMMKGAANATVTSVDAWPSAYDPFSWGSSYSFTNIENDYAVLHFRGESLKWYATVPAGKTAATVKIEQRSKTTGTWSSWSTLESSFSMPTGPYAANVIYEITYESHQLAADTTYEIKITNLDGGFCSIDSFEGYWAASMSNYNEDSKKMWISNPQNTTQIYDKRFSGGSMYKFNRSDGIWNAISISFIGDRVILFSAKGRNHGKARILLTTPTGTYDVGTTGHMFIPGGDVTDGSLLVDLNTGKRGEEIPQYVIFDSNDYFPNGLPWGRYGCYIAYAGKDIEQFCEYPNESNNFKPRCSDCVAQTGTCQNVNKYIYFDGAMVHEAVGLTVKFDNQTHLDILKSTAEAIQTEWGVTDNGIRLEPRIGTDTNEVLREGQNTVVSYKIANDVSKVASMLLSNGSDIDGLPLFTITEDRKNRDILDRTIMRQEDFRNIGSYTELIGLSRMQLKKRRYPEKRIQVQHIAKSANLVLGDTFILYTKKGGPIRVRINRLEISETSSGRLYDMECVVWPTIPTN